MQNGERIRDYRLETKIGVGGMGQVWRARHLELDRRVAIKALAAELSEDSELEERFVQEARAQATLDHPRILGVNDFFRHQGIYYLVMPLIEGESLEVLMHRAGGPLPVDQVLAIAQDVLDALDYAHRRGVVHRDVKPSNVLLDRDGRAYLMDFGIALLLGRDRKTRTGVSMGTPHYMSPEQILHPKTLDHRTDVYSMGCVLYEALTGRTPFQVADDGDTDYQIKHAHLSVPPVPIRQVNPDVPEGVADPVMRALVKDPAERIAGCGELLRALRAYQYGGTVTAPPPPAGPPDPPTAPGVTAQAAPSPSAPPSPPQPERGRGRATWFLLGAGAGCLALLVGLGLVVLLAVMAEQSTGPATTEADAVVTDEAETPPPSNPVADREGPPAGDGVEDGGEGGGAIPDLFRSGLQESLDNRGDYYGNYGYDNPAFNPYFGKLDRGTGENLYFTLVPGYEYKVLGVCDGDCDNLSFTLWDPDGGLVDQDHAVDSIPVVDAAPAAEGRYRMWVEMEDCSTRFCYYGVAIYQRPAE